MGETAQSLSRYLLQCATMLGDLDSQDIAGWACFARILGCEICCSKKCQVALVKQQVMGVLNVSEDQRESRLYIFFWLEKVLFLSLAGSFLADYVSLAVEGKARAKCKCHKIDLTTIKLQGRAERARAEKNLPSHFANNLPDLEEADRQQVFQASGTAIFPNVSRYFHLNSLPSSVSLRKCINLSQTPP